MRYLQILIPTLLIFTGSAYAGETDVDKTDNFVPNIQPLLDVSKTIGSILIDGDLNDVGWIGAARATNFTQAEPTDMVKPQSATTAFITYDDENLYIAVIAVDDDPSSIRSSLRDRDRIFSDDLVGFILDTYGDASWAYEVFANPNGIQGDLRWTQRGKDSSFDIVYKSEGKITATGYQVEFAIPFASLRFPDKNVQDWKITFWRIRPRESREQYSWAAISKDDPCFACQFGSLKGIENVKPGKSFEILPTITSSQAGFRDLDIPGSSLQNGDINGDASIGIRYRITSNTSIEGTINPDFSQVESDVSQIDVNNTFALFFPERRPFFQEGSDLFNGWYNVVHTRSINDPSFATKLTSRTNEISYAYIGAVDERSPLIIPGEEGSNIVSNLGKSYSNILRVRRSCRAKGLL
ncbi:MAG: carbohydrate binding family 9 domain-containing protein [Candidatus Marinimicrobia bacterium]|nr:carbohydrate binding family 9 domain-containing protein [Candidatus Neomarinimicrobiota bacterium]